MLRRRPKSSAGKYRLYCNLGYNLSEEVVRRYFQQLCTQGQILDVYIPRHNSGRNKGYGFATFETETDLLNALQSPEHVIEGNVVKINRAGPRPDYDKAALQQDQQQQFQASAHGKGPRLYVGGIPDEVHEDDIKAHFEQWGSVVDIYFPGKSGLKRVNYCFVTFESWQAAQQSCNQSERSIGGKLIQSISLAEERTAENTESGLVAFGGQATPLSSLGLAGLKSWTEQFENLSLGQVPVLPGAEANLAAPRLPASPLPPGPFSESRESYANPALIQALATGSIDDSLHEQGLLQSMQQQQAAPRPPYFPNWLLDREAQAHMPEPRDIQQSSNLPGYDPTAQGLQTGRPALGKMTEGELQALQHAMSLEQHYPTQFPSGGPRRPQEGDRALLYPFQQDLTADGFRQNWQTTHPAAQRQPFDDIAAAPLPGFPGHHLTTPAGQQQSRRSSFSAASAVQIPRSPGMNRSGGDPFTSDRTGRQD